METMRLPLTRQEVTVVLEDGQGAEKRLVLRELDGAERNRYLNKMRNRVQIQNGKATGIKSFDGFQADLLTMSLFSEDGVALLPEEIDALPSSTQQTLFEKAQRMSGLDREISDDSKND